MKKKGKRRCNSEKAYHSLSATNHELSSRKNEMRLDAAIKKLRSGKSGN